MSLGKLCRFRRRLARPPPVRPDQHRWLCARVPCKLAWHDRLGIELPALVVAGLEMVNLSPYYFTQQDHDLAAIRKLVPSAAVCLEYLDVILP